MKETLEAEFESSRKPRIEAQEMYMGTEYRLALEGSSDLFEEEFKIKIEDFLKKIVEEVAEKIKTYSLEIYKREGKFNVYSDGSSIRIVGGLHEFTQKDVDLVKEIERELNKKYFNL